MSCLHQIIIWVCSRGDVAPRLDAPRAGVVRVVRRDLALREELVHAAVVPVAAGPDDKEVLDNKLVGLQEAHGPRWAPRRTASRRCLGAA